MDKLLYRHYCKSWLRICGVQWNEHIYPSVLCISGKKIQAVLFKSIIGISVLLLLLRWSGERNRMKQFLFMCVLMMRDGRNLCYVAASGHLWIYMLSSMYPLLWWRNAIWWTGVLILCLDEDDIIIINLFCLLLPNLYVISCRSVNCIGI